MEEISRLLGEARSLSAWEVASALDPLARWEGFQARDTAARLAGELGNSRLRDALRSINARRYPANDVAFLHGLFSGISRRGPMATLERIEARLAAGGPAEATDRADLLAFKGGLLGRLHDFEPAYRAIDEAIALLPGGPGGYWPRVQRSVVLEFEDRYEEALETAREAVQCAPLKSSAVLQLVDCLIHRGLDDEAIAVLESSHRQSESPAFAIRLVHLFSEREDHARALAFLDEFDRRSPLMDKRNRDWSNRRRGDFLYMAGDFEGALAHFERTTEDSYHTRVAKKMRRSGALAKGRKRLNVPFTRQHDVTCAPATLASLAAYWGMEFDHLAIADAICYDGTPWHKERAWAESHGFCATEFRLTHAIAVALIDRGIPFTLTTESISSGHLQACIGYDDRQEILLLRDPTERHFGEIILEGLVEDHPVQGPRCMLLLPLAETGRIADLHFPDAALYDANHQVSLAIDAHDREAARAAVASMPPDAPLTAWAEFRLARYDENPVAALRIIDALAERFPENASLRSQRLFALQRAAGDPARQRKLIEEELRRTDCDPVFYSEMGEWLLRDARELPMADYYLRKAVRLGSRTSRVYGSLAYCRWKERRFADSARYRRIASCLSRAFEPYASAYAEVCRALGHPEEGLAFLRKRVEAQGKKSAGPWQTLAGELEAQRRTAEAIAVLADAMEARPDDGALMLSGGRQLTLWGEQERGEQLILCARGKVREAEWHRGMARMHEFLGRRKEAIAHWQALLELEPHSEEGHRVLAYLLADEEGPLRTRQHLAAATEKHPQFPWLWSLRATWDAKQSPAEALVSLEKARALDPDDLWVLRELAIQRFHAGDKQTALADAREAVRKGPHAPASHKILGDLLEALGEREKAAHAYRDAIRLDVDHTEASTALVETAASPVEILGALRFIEAEMRRQVSNGDIVPEYRDLAYRHLEPEVLLKKLREFCEERPDLWQTWSARREQASDMGLADEAFQCARALTERFPLLPRAWTELAQAHRAVSEYPEAIAALERAVDLSPAWDWAARQLAEALERMERYDEALKVLERALQHEPLVAQNYGCLAGLLRKLGRREEAFERLLVGMRHCPSYFWGWGALAEWSGELHRQEEVAALLDLHRNSCAHLASWWAKTSSVLNDLGRKEEALATLEAGLRRHPGEIGLLDEQARLLSDQNRFDAALAVCEEGLRTPAGFPVLAGRRALIRMQAGEPNEAIRLMTALIAERPDYTWGIRLLAGWLDARKQWSALRDLCLRWARQEPQYPLVYGFLAQAERNLSNPAGARKAFEKAFALDPEYAYAGRELLSCQIADGELDAAAQTLRTLEHYVHSAAVLGDAVELAVAKKDLPEAKERARELLARDDAEVAVLNWVKDLFAKNRWTRQWWALLDARAASKGVTEPVLKAWILSLPGRRRIGKAVRRLKAFSAAQEELKASGWVTLLANADFKKNANRIRWWIWRNRAWFRSRNDLWAEAGSALLEIEDYKACIRWLRDWEARGAEVPCEALFNCAVAIETVQGWQAGAPIRKEALRRFPSHALSPALRAVVTLQTLLGGDQKAAKALAEQVEPEWLTRVYNGYYALYRSIAAATEGKLDTAERQYREALEIFNPFWRARSCITLFQSTTERLAQVVPWAKGNPSAIRRKWGRYTGVNRGMPLWRIVLLVLFLLWFLGTIS